MEIQFLIIYTVTSMLNFLKTKVSNDPIKQDHMDIACSMQNHFKNIILKERII